MEKRQLCAKVMRLVCALLINWWMWQPQTIETKKDNGNINIRILICIEQLTDDDWLLYFNSIELRIFFDEKFKFFFPFEFTSFWGGMKSEAMNMDSMWPPQVTESIECSVLSEKETSLLNAFDLAVILVLAFDYDKTIR